MYDQKESNIDGIKKAVIQNLLSKKTEIEATITNLKEQRRNESQFRSIDSSFEEIDRADNEISAQQYYGLLERKYSELKRVETLVNRIYINEDFGWCEDCGERISPKRLSVMPDATRCIACQREHEKMESRKGYTTVKYKDSSGNMDQDDEDIEDTRELKAYIGSVGGGAISMDDLEEVDLVENDDEKEDDSSSDDEEEE
jgi:DnaK suppressor protein